MALGGSSTGLRTGAGTVSPAGGGWHPQPPVTGAMPQHGFSPGGNFSASLTSSVKTFEENEMLTISQGKPCLVRVDNTNVIQELLNLGFDVSYVVGNTWSGFSGIPGGSVGAFGDICGNFAATWKGVTGPNGNRVRIIQIGGNEQNSGPDNSPKCTPAQQIQIFQDATPKIRAADPTLLISNGGVSNGPTGGTIGDLRLWSNAHCDAAVSAGTTLNALLDMWDLHCYADPNATGSWNPWRRGWAYPPGGGTRDNTFPLGTTIREYFDAHHADQVKLWCGECNDSNHTPDPTVVTTIMNLMQARRNAGEKVGPTTIFTMRCDWVTIGTDSGFGLTDLNRNRRPAWTSVYNGIATE